MRGQRIPPCEVCGRNTPPLGETVCRNCQSVSEAMDQRAQAQTEFYANIDDVECEHTRQCLRALFHLARGDER